MKHYTESECDECGETLIKTDGEYLCPSCDSLSGFTLVPDDDEFVV